MDLFDDLPPPKAADPAPPSVEQRKRSADLLDASEEQTKAKHSKINEAITLMPFVSSRQGERPEMEDAHQLIVDFRADVKDLHPDVKRLAYFAVFDGHNGAHASRLAAAELHKHIATRLRGDPATLEREFKRKVIEAFREFDDAFLKQASKQRPVWRDGCTACVCLIINDSLFTANLGDTRAVLCSERLYHPNTVSASQQTAAENSQAESGSTESKITKAEQLQGAADTTEIVAASNETETIKRTEAWLAVQLSTDHNPLEFEERQRIQQAGGVVRNGRVNEALEVSRSFGDYSFKKSGVTYIPDVSKYSLNTNDKFLIIACDGLWKAVTNDEAVRTVWSMVHTSDSSINTNVSGRPSLPKRGYEEACAELANLAVRRLTGDNVTVVIVALHA